MDRDIQRKRLKYRATHRGTKEADALVGGFVEDRLEVLSESELDSLESLLDCTDPDILDWLMNRQPLPDNPGRQALDLIAKHQKHLLTD